MNPRELVFSQDAVEAQKANQIYREIVEKANVAILANERTIVKARFQFDSTFWLANQGPPSSEHQLENL